jgi:hypothetical protein
VRWELSPGTGHGARLVLTQTGRGGDPAGRDAALAAWRPVVETLARELLATPRAGGQIPPYGADEAPAVADALQNASERAASDRT